MQWWDTCRGQGQPQNVANSIQCLLNWDHLPMGLAHPVIQSNCSIVQNSPPPFGYIHSTPPQYSRLIQLSLLPTNFNCFCCLIIRSICIYSFSSEVVVFTNQYHKNLLNIYLKQHILSVGTFYFLYKVKLPSEVLVQ